MNCCPSNLLSGSTLSPPSSLCQSTVYTDNKLGGGGGCSVESCWRPYSAGEFNPLISDKIQNLQNCQTTPNKNLGGRRHQADKHLPQSPFYRSIFLYDDILNRCFIWLICLWDQWYYMYTTHRIAGPRRSVPKLTSG